MSEPVTSAPAHPWRRVIRTAFAWVTGIAAFVPIIVDASDLSEATPGLAGALGLSSAITRILARPDVEAFLQRRAPWLAADDIAADTVVAHVAPDGKVVAGEASVVPTGQEIKMPTVESEARKPARRRKATKKATPDAGDVDLTTVLVVLAIVVLVLIIADRV